MFQLLLVFTPSRCATLQPPSSQILATLGDTGNVIVNHSSKRQIATRPSNSSPLTINNFSFAIISSNEHQLFPFKLELRSQKFRLHLRLWAVCWRNGMCVFGAAPVPHTHISQSQTRTHTHTHRTHSALFGRVVRLAACLRSACESSVLARSYRRLSR